VLRRWAEGRQFYTPESSVARELGRSFREKLERGEPVYLIGLGPGGHDSGAALVEVTARDGIRLLSSHEEERFSGVRHESGPPLQSLAQIRSDLDRLGLFRKDIHVHLASFDYVRMFAGGVESFFQEVPRSAGLVRSDIYPGGLGPLWRAFRAARLVASELPGASPRVVGMGHHGNHASFAWALSPFAQLREPVLVLVLDATGDGCAISAYLARNQRLSQLHQNRSFWDSLGHFYGLVSSSFGGWPVGSAEGRWMAAAAFGNQDPGTNRYYGPLRRLLHSGENGSILIDRALAHWHVSGAVRPFSRKFLDALGGLRAVEAGWEGLSFQPASRVPELADLAAASQLVFEEALQHVVDHWVAATGARRVILTGGTALNCVALRKVLERSHRDGVGQRGFSIWVPPAPADEATPAGSAIHFALRNGGRPGEPLQHAFYCGDEPSTSEIESALSAAHGVETERLEVSSGPPGQLDLARLLSLIVADDGVVGLFRGRAEIGRRALGHRSIFASPRRPAMRDFLNRAVKFRDLFRPFAPVCTLRDAPRWFHVDQPLDGEAASIYRWMGLAVRARTEAFERIPGALHVDGTARLQIAPGNDTLLVSFLEALGRQIHAEVALNTSLNLHAPIVQTPAQAAQLLRNSPGLDAIVFVARSGEAYLAWTALHNRERSRRIQSWLNRWRGGEGLPRLRALTNLRG
jgi:carbamoyltransferase